MLRIRKEQMAVLGEAMRRNFEDRALAYLARRYPQALKQRGESGMRALLKAAQVRGKRYGLASEIGVIALAELAIVYGDEVYRREAWAWYLLHQTDLDEPTRVERLRGYLPATQEEGAYA